MSDRKWTIKATASYLSVRNSSGRRVAGITKAYGTRLCAELLCEAGEQWDATGRSPAKLAAELAASQAEVARLRGALEKYETVREDMFGHFCSNGMFNAWGKPFDCTGLNDAHQQATAALAR